jgi:hypothetical protein
VTWLPPSWSHTVDYRSCLACEVGQRTAAHEPCWSCSGPTTTGQIWPQAAAGIIAEWMVQP